jgi:hypothetical protein
MTDLQIISTLSKLFRLSDIDFVPNSGEGDRLAVTISGLGTLYLYSDIIYCIKVQYQPLRLAKSDNNLIEEISRYLKKW